MNLSDLATTRADEGAVLELRHPATDEVIEGMTITLLGKDSATYRKIELRRTQAVLHRVNKGKKAAELDAEKLQDDTLDDLVALTKGWSGFEEGGKEITFSPAEAKKIYANPGLRFIREQAEAFINDRANFFR